MEVVLTILKVYFICTVLLMLINPGYAGSAKEKQVPYGERKIRELRDMIQQRELPVKIEIDGRISPDNILCYGKELVDIFVTGSTCLKRDDLTGSWAALRALRQQALSQ